MVIDTIASAGIKWLWEQYGKDFTDKATEEIQARWHQYKWKDAEIKYLSRMQELHGTTRLLGHPKPISIEDIFTSVYVLDMPTAFRRYDLSALRSRPYNREVLNLEKERKPALRIAVTEKRLFILGKPGAGKTTFLKFLTLQACHGKIPKTPIFISLKEWGDSELDLMQFIAQEFEICSFPDAYAFIRHMLATGEAIVMFDGLDEVNKDDNKRSLVIREITKFSTRYPKSSIFVTCRIASTDYTFEKFTYLEIADFDEKQMQLFVSRWYRDTPKKHDRFVNEFHHPENQGLRELARTPLLLALICLAFDETLSLPLRRVDLYREAIDALLRKWDASRDIKRDEPYRFLSPLRKEQLLARIAAINFETTNYFFHEDVLTQQISEYIRQFPNVVDINDIDGASILKSIEAQHGILVERAHKIYSFSHLTFQEYFTARYVVDNAAGGTIPRLIQNHFVDETWREIFVLTASLLNNADPFFEVLIHETKTLINFEACDEILDWVNKKAQASSTNSLDTRAILLFTALALTRPRNHRHDPPYPDNECYTSDHPLNLARKLAQTLVLGINKDRGQGLDLAVKTFFNNSLARALSRELNLGVEIETDDIECDWKLSQSQATRMAQYIQANLLLIECLHVATVTDRSGFEQQLLTSLDRK